MIYDQAIAAIFCYLSGSIPFGLILIKLSDLGDIRTIGSGNIGAANVLRAGGKKLAALTLLFDSIKAFIPLLILKKLGFQQEVLFLFASASIIGHVFPVWLKFKGGKGVATALGAMMLLEPIVALISLVVWGVVVKTTRTSSLGALSAFLIAPVTSYSLSEPYCFTFALGLCLLIFWTHRENIFRLMKSKEYKF